MRGTSLAIDAARSPSRLARFPLDFIARLAAVAPEPWVNLMRFHGVFAQKSGHRARVYVERPDGSRRFRRVAIPNAAGVARLTQNLARHIGRYLEPQGLLERDAENGYLTAESFEAGPMDAILGSSITYRIADGPQEGRKVFTLQTLPACVDERNKLERLCLCISRPTIAEKHLSLTPSGNVRFQPKRPNRGRTTHVISSHSISSPGWRRRYLSRESM